MTGRDDGEHGELEALAALDPAQEVFLGLTAADLLFAMTPEPLGDLRAGTATYTADAGEQQRLHWYAPAAAGSYPAVVFVHSGSWSGGSATAYLRYASDLARRGFVTASMDYRLTPDARWPDPADDVRAALAWMRSDPLGLGVDPSAVSVAGGSAGAHLAAMAVLQPAATRPLDVAAAVLWYPPLRLATMAGVEGNAGAVEDLLGGLRPELLDEASPITHVSPEAPPILTLVGDQDPICPVADAQAFHAALDRVGVPNELHVFPGGMHGFDLTRRWYAVSFEHLVRFLRSRLPPA